MGLIPKLFKNASLERVVSKVGKSAAHVVDNRLETDTTRPILITCEHASNVLPVGYSFKNQKYIGSKDVTTMLQDSHWGYDPGALDTASSLSKAVSGVMVASSYSRLLIDVNRPVASDTLIRYSCDGVDVELNKDLTIDEIEKRVSQFYSPFHMTVGAVKNLINPSMLLSVHSFNKEYPGGAPRDYEVGVLFSHEEELANEFHLQFEKAGISARLNQPYSGKQGIMYSVEGSASPFDGTTTRLPSIMCEFRNDVILDKEWRERAVAVMASVALCRDMSSE